MDNDEVGSSVMNRRNVLVGLGAAATGSSVVLGSGAFAGVSTARSVTIAVDKDSEALVQLEAGAPTPVEENDSGELEISTENFGGAFNEEATVEIGDPDNPGTTPAFSVTNNFNKSIELTLNLKNIDSDGYFTLHFASNFDSSDTLDSNSKATDTVSSDSDGTVDIAIEIDTQSAESNFDGTIQIDANESEETVS